LQGVGNTCLADPRALYAQQEFIVSVCEVTTIDGT
jgi:hypothetical protein